MDGGLRGPAQVRAAAQVFVDDLEALTLSEDDTHHLGRVLRLRPGETVVAADGRGGWRTCRTTASDGLLEADGPLRHDGPPAAPVTVGFVPVKGERPEWVVQKLTELGVDRIVVLRSARQVVRWEGERGTRALDRLRRVAREAAAQSRRSHLPALEAMAGPAGLVGALAPELLALADPGGDPLAPEVRAVAVGPEGGWDEEERATPGTVRVGLGPAVLRAETAALAAAVLVCGRRDGVL